MNPSAVLGQMKQNIGSFSLNFEMPKYGDRRKGQGGRIDDAYIKARNGDYPAHMLVCRGRSQRRTRPYQAQPFPILECRLDILVCLTPIDAAARNLERNSLRRHAFFHRAPDVGSSVVDGEVSLYIIDEQDVYPHDVIMIAIDTVG